MSSDHFNDLQSQIQGAVVCSSCDSVYKIADHRLSCANCGAALVLAEDPGMEHRRRDVGTYAFLKPLAKLVDSHLKSVGMLAESGGPSLKKRVEGHVKCGWCGAEHQRRPNTPNCSACGGVVPLPPSADPGPAPPPAPRNLPRAFGQRLFITQNLGGWIGVLTIALSIPMVCAMGPFAIFFFLFGWALAHSNFLTAYRRRAALRSGTSVVGKIESVHLIGEPHEGKPMFRVYFRFDADGQPLRGWKYSYDYAMLNHFVGQPVWVVYLPHKHASHDIWPPLA